MGGLFVYLYYLFVYLLRLTEIKSNYYVNKI